MQPKQLGTAWTDAKKNIFCSSHDQIPNKSRIASLQIQPSGCDLPYPPLDLKACNHTLIIGLGINRIYLQSSSTGTSSVGAVAK